MRSLAGAGRERTAAAAICASVTLLATLLAFWWSTTDRITLTGDEPHYLILTASLLRDGDLDIGNNYAEDARTREIYGPVEVRHSVGRDGREWPSHTPGISVLLVPAFALAGGLGARLMLCLLIIPILGWACWRWFRDRAPPGDVALVIAGVLLCPPVLFGSSQVYPDLLAGAILLALAVSLWHAPRRTPGTWALWWLVAGGFTWLHIRFLATTTVLPLIGAWQLSRDQQWRDGASERWQSHAAVAGLFLVGAAAFVLFQLATYGDLFSARLGEMNQSIWRAAEFFIGWHLDQSNGVFLMQPLLLAGPVALGWMAYRRHPLTIPWILLYASLVVPQAMRVHWGGAPAGRFNWTSMWLWLIPIGLWLEAERETLGRYVRPTVLAAIVLQAALAIRWLTEPTVLFQRGTDLVWARDSLFPLPVRYILPHFYLSAGDGWWVVRYLEYLPNLIWVTAAVLLVVTGWMWSVDGRRRLRPVWIGGIAVAALLLPVEPTADAESGTDDGLHEPMVQSIQSTFPRRFEAERMTPMQTADRTTRLDAQASGGRARASDEGRRDGLVTFGPYLDVDPGRYRIEAAMRLRTPSDAAPAAWLDVRTERGQVSHGRVDIPAARLPTDGSYTIVSVSIESPQPFEDLEFIVGAHPGVDLLVDYIDLIPVLP